MLGLASLDLPMDAGLRRNDYHASLPPGVIAGEAGNSMGYAPNSITAATIGDGAGATAWFEGNFSGGTLKAPFNVRTETATNNTGYFVTASGGYLQNLLYGFAGLRIQETGLSESYPPILPVEWKSMTLKGIAFRGRRYDIVVDRDPAGRVHDGPVRHHRRGNDHHREPNAIPRGRQT